MISIDYQDRHHHLHLREEMGSGEVSAFLSRTPFEWENQDLPCLGGLPALPGTRCVTGHLAVARGPPAERCALVTKARGAEHGLPIPEGSKHFAPYFFVPESPRKT